MSWLLVGLGGALGALLRLAVWTGFDQFRLKFPFGTMTVNVTGSFAIGVLTAYLMTRPNDNLRNFVAFGILGGYTTFSSFSVETLRLAREGRAFHAVAYVAGSVFLSLAAVGAGLAAGRSIWIPGPPVGGPS